MNTEEIKTLLKKHQNWIKRGGERPDFSSVDLKGADLQGVVLRGANLRGACLIGADLRGANLDFSCLPLSCGGLSWIMDRELMAQLAYHFCSMRCADNDVIALQNALIPFANEMHRTDVPRLNTKPNIIFFQVPTEMQEQ
jgi:uncharacterized protein YjbI with pentapeptide repeats